ncbi:MAG: hypothetical protein R2771_15290 [Saprospiraceae bacterium]
MYLHRLILNSVAIVSIAMKINFYIHENLHGQMFGMFIIAIAAAKWQLL